jgi:hypothetical protein
MKLEMKRSEVSLAVIAALSSAAMGAAPSTALANKVPGKYVAGDFHNHTTCSDGSISMQKLVKKSTDKADTPWGLDWFVQAGHGGNGNRNCTLVEDATLTTPAYPFVVGKGPTTTWAASVGAASVKGNLGLTSATPDAPLSSLADPRMWRWQSLEEFQYPLLEYLNAYKNLPLFLGLESVVAGHEHSSMSVISGQMPAAIDSTPLPGGPPYTALGDATALAKWSYCFDRGDTDNSRGGAQAWDCSVTGSLNSANPSWNATARKLFPTPSGLGSSVGRKGHEKTVEAMKWMKEFHPNASYYVPAHLERAGPFNPDGNNGFNIEHLRNFNNAAPTVAFGMETQPGHHASDQRGEYTIRRNNFFGVNVDSVGGTTYGGTGVYGAQIGGVWDALLGEGRNYWFFGSSDWHNRGSFGPDDRRSTQDFYPGEYQRNYTVVRNGADPKLRPQAIVDGLRSGNTFVDSGQLIDRLAFVACASYPGPATRSNAAVENLAVNAALNGTDIAVAGCATMGEKLKVQPGGDIVVSIVVRDPSGTNYSPYTFDNPSLVQVGIDQPLNAPVLDHIDVIRGQVTGYRKPGKPGYSGEWPRDWIEPYRIGGAPSLATVPAAARNTSAAVIKTFNGTSWTPVAGNGEFKKMTFRIPAVQSSQYVRLRGTNLPPSVPWETDADGNPLPDLWTNSSAVNPTVAGGNDGIPANGNLRIKCSAVGTNVPANGVVYTGNAIDGCPEHLPVIGGSKYVAYDVAAWADLWFYSNPIFVEVGGATKVAGVK